MPGLEDRVTTLEAQVAAQRTQINELSANMFQVLQALIQHGFRSEDHERRIVALEERTGIK